MDKAEILSKDNKTEQRILDAAKIVFYRKGLSGARMHEIADAAGINKAMLNYYFRSKDKLFEAVFRDGVQKIFPVIRTIISSDLPLFEKIETFADTYISVLTQNPYLPGFILNEVNNNPERLMEVFLGNVMEMDVYKKFSLQVETAVKEGIIKPTDPKQLIVNLMSMCIFPFAAKPVIKVLINLDEENYSSFLEKRKKEIPLFIINAIKVN